ADVLAAAGASAPAPRRAPERANADGSPAVAAQRTPGDGVEGARGPGRRVQPSRLQLLVARRMAEAKATIPHFQVQTEVAMDAAMSLRAALKASAIDQVVPSVTDLIVKACAIALRGHPRANGSYADGAFQLHGRINVGIAVAADDALVVPVIADADTRSLGAIARETRLLAERVRGGTITPPECSGATFTVSNLGMYGMTAISPVINPPQAAILGVGSLRETLARVDGEIVDRTLMTLTLSCDHRILYGADAARLLADVRALLEAPLGLAL
ncbi:MAG: 2-oxo acid dehydrogenase subunit, partial [Solirubrobacterales bacterium]|nr:2-oxo acid dehydrogenase subunit [Solirubrobacterales bacterium]